MPSMSSKSNRNGPAIPFSKYLSPSFPPSRTASALNFLTITNTGMLYAASIEVSWIVGPKIYVAIWLSPNVFITSSASFSSL